MSSRYFVVDIKRRHYHVFVAFATILIPALSEVCTVCSNPEHEMFDLTAVVSWPPGNPDTRLVCSDIAEKTVNGFFSSCEQIHSYSDITCACESTAFTCPLCGTENAISDPSRKVAGKTCQEWQDHTTAYAISSDCSYYQKSLGAYCGCDISEPNFFNDFCRLCQNKILPKFNKKVSFSDGSQKFCVKVELDTNVNDKDCTSQQQDFASVCGCDDSEPQLPTLQPTIHVSQAKKAHDGQHAMMMITSVVSIVILWTIM